MADVQESIEVLVIVHDSSNGTYEESKVGDGRVRSFDLTTKASGKAIELNYGIEEEKTFRLLIQIPSWKTKL